MDAQNTPAAPEIRNLDETSRFFSITVPTLKRWIEDGCPVEKRGGNGVSWELDLRRVADWRRLQVEDEQKKALDRASTDEQLRLELLGDDSLPDISAGDIGKLSARGRAEIIRAEMDKVKLAQLRRDLVRAEEVRADQARIFALIRDRLRTLPDNIGARFGLQTDQVDEALSMIEELLDDLATDIESMPSLKSELVDAQAA